MVSIGSGIAIAAIWGAVAVCGATGVDATPLVALVAVFATALAAGN